MKFINLTPHKVVLNSGEVFLPEATPVRISTSYTPFIDGVCEVKFGQLVGLPEPQEGVVFIVSGMAAQAAAVLGR